MKVAEQDCGLRASYHQNNEDEKQKSEHVVHLTRPKETQQKYFRSQPTLCK
jgi:hypothetical protein